MQVFRFALLVLICACLSSFARADKEADDEKAEHDAAKAVLAAAKIDLMKAIETAMAKVPNTEPVYASTVKANESLRFDVFLWTGKSVTEVKVDAVSGDVKKVEENEDDDVEDLEDAKKVLAKSKITFGTAIATAKIKVAGGKPFAIGAEIEDGKLIIEVEMLAGEKVMIVEIDALTGNVLEVEEETD